eukprot:NODE_3001_length_717_cov_29.300898_g2118_i0.p1 GENE.NODE_3001_length_717_cov_29.300898_g2118_i0~~NODE_3001_length_717_cov_29.300898_g2118_i0.p1  ORF type:complete len:101 (-),score=21.66 NODE_3001_length_717_cov_29.300898_g2118_i0:17-319(-)
MRIVDSFIEQSKQTHTQKKQKKKNNNTHRMKKKKHTIASHGTNTIQNICRETTFFSSTVVAVFSPALSWLSLFIFCHPLRILFFVDSSITSDLSPPCTLR